MSENPAWRCGHPRTPDNTIGRKQPQCRECAHRANRDYRRSTNGQMNYRVRVLPEQLAAAERRVIHLRREAARLGLPYLAEQQA